MSQAYHYCAGCLVNIRLHQLCWETCTHPNLPDRRWSSVVNCLVGCLFSEEFLSIIEENINLMTQHFSCVHKLVTSLQLYIQWTMTFSWSLRSQLNVTSPSSLEWRSGDKTACTFCLPDITWHLGISQTFPLYICALAASDHTLEVVEALETCFFHN